MSTQNIKNHAQVVPLYHYFMTAVILTILVLASINLFNGVSMLSVMFFLMAIALSLGMWFMRAFALKVQDRAIRAEENLRYYSLTGRLLDKNLRTSQIIALRFADDEEFVDLADAALEKNMNNKEIKQAIQNWKADHHRV